MDPHDELIAAIATILASRVEHFDCEQHPAGHSYLMLRAADIGGVLSAMHNAMLQLERRKETIGVIKRIAGQFPTGVSMHADKVKSVIAAWENQSAKLSDATPSHAIN